MGVRLGFSKFILRSNHQTATGGYVIVKGKVRKTGICIRYLLISMPNVAASSNTLELPFPMSQITFPNTIPIRPNCKLKRNP